MSLKYEPAGAGRAAVAEFLRVHDRLGLRVRNWCTNPYRGGEELYWSPNSRELGRWRGERSSTARELCWSPTARELGRHDPTHRDAPRRANGIHPPGSYASSRGSYASSRHLPSCATLFATSSHPLVSSNVRGVAATASDGYGGGGGYHEGGRGAGDRYRDNDRGYDTGGGRDRGTPLHERSAPGRASNAHDAPELEDGDELGVRWSRAA